MNRQIYEAMGSMSTIHLHSFLNKYDIPYPAHSDSDLTDNLNNKKKEVLTDLLKLIKKFQMSNDSSIANSTTLQVINNLRDIGLQWPELEKIRKSLDHDINTQQKNYFRPRDELNDNRMMGNQIYEAPKDINTFSEEDQIRIVSRSWKRLKEINNPSKAVQIAAVTKSWEALGLMKKTLKDYMPRNFKKTTIKESISDKPSINAQIEKLLEKEPKAKQTLILDALESLQKAGSHAISPDLWASSVRLLHPDPAFPIMDVLKTIAKNYTFCVKRVGPGQYIWDDSDRGIDDVSPETRAAVGSQVKLGDMVMKIMKRTGEFTVDQIAGLVSQSTGMPAAQAAEYVKHIISQFEGNTILSLGNGRYKINADRAKTADSQIDDMKRLAGLRPKD